MFKLKHQLILDIQKIDLIPERLITFKLSPSLIRNHRIDSAENLRLLFFGTLKEEIKHALDHFLGKFNGLNLSKRRSS